ncbi:MAG: tRNA guanosine(34) transglycosylase Tgt [Deltaproteobacteria bacterium]|nr:tRNA guanosine(34) transglycosylase Tgt [Deltaproteobacteria bacterium]
MSLAATKREESTRPGTFEVLAADGPARRGRLATAHGCFDTPAFMPVATQGTVKGLTPAQLRELGAQIVLSNAYHLSLRPGSQLIRDLGGLHRFMGWDGPILTDSGGYQIFSLAALRKISDAGVEFRSHVDGAAIFLSPEDVVRIQVDLGVDIIMVLDECAPGESSRDEAQRAAERSFAWAERCRATATGDGQLMFGIVQGGIYPELRVANARKLVTLNFPGYAVGGLSVGEDRAITMAVAEGTVAELPSNRPRYLMGVGLPEDLIRFVNMGYDMFDCVLPTRNGRNGMLFTSRGKLNVRLARYARDERPADPDCTCYSCRSFSRAYLRHLSQTNEMLGGAMASLHNLHFYQTLMREMRAAIEANRLAAWSSVALVQLNEGIDA